MSDPLAPPPGPPPPPRARAARPPWVAPVGTFALGLVAGFGLFVATDEDPQPVTVAAPPAALQQLMPSAPTPAAFPMEGSDSLAPTDDRGQALKNAAEGYTNALIAKNYALASQYLHPDCTEEEENEFIGYGMMFGPDGGGATIRANSVEIRGDRGSVTDITLSEGAPDQIRRMLSGAISDDDRTFPWYHVNGEWYFAGPCAAVKQPVPAT